jgi:ribonuclease HI
VLPRATIICDASYYAPGIAGWAAWVKRDGADAETWGGKIRAVWVDTGNASELCGIAAALTKFADRYGQQHAVMIMCDNIRALRLMVDHVPGVRDNPYKNAPPMAFGQCAGPTGAEKRLLDAVGDAGLAKLSVRHVKGHHPRHRGGEGRNGANCKCDEVAKVQMRELRAELLGERPEGWPAQLRERLPCR